MLHDAPGHPVRDYLFLYQKLRREDYASQDSVLFGLEFSLHHLLANLYGRQPNELAARIKGILEDNAADPHFRLSDVLEHIPYTADHVRRIFKQVFGISMLSFLNWARLSGASDLLVHSALPITEVARRSGFENPGYFSRLFRAQYGVSPSEYRKKGGV